MRVRLDRIGPIHRQQLAAHTQVQDRRTSGGLNQKVLGSPAHIARDLADQSVTNRPERHRLAQVLTQETHVHELIITRLFANRAREAFNFWQFRHKKNPGPR